MARAKAGRAFLLAAGLLTTSMPACGSRTALRPGSTSDAHASSDAAAADLGDGSPSSIDGSVFAVDGRCPTNAYRRDAVCVCQTTTPKLCSDACVDLVSDPANCGACGHACVPTATCRVGVCGPPSKQIVPAAPGCGGIDLAIAGATLYWTDRGHGVVRTLTLPDGAPNTIATTAPGARLVAVSGSQIFWVDITSTMAVPDMGAGPATLTTAGIHTVPRAGNGLSGYLVSEANLNGGIRGLAVSADGATVFYSADTNVRAVPAAGGSAIDVGHEEMGGVPTALALDGNEIASPIDFNGDVDVIEVVEGTVASCGNFDPMTGAPLNVNCARAARGQGQLLLGSVVLDAGFAYWADGDELERDVDSGPLATALVYGCIAGDCDDDITAFVGGSDGLYAGTGAGALGAATGTFAGVIAKVPYAEKATSVALATGDSLPHALVLDASHVYWSTDDCAIYSVAR